MLKRWEKKVDKPEERMQRLEQTRRGRKPRKSGREGFREELVFNAAGRPVIH